MVDENVQVLNASGSLIANLVDKATTGTAGKETGAASPSTDISGGAATKFKIAVDGGEASEVTLTLDGLNTGALIAAAMQTGIRALNGAFANVTVAFTGGVYVITSGTQGSASKVRVTAGSSADVAAALKIGAANGAVAVDGTSVGLITNGFTAQVTTRSRLMVMADKAGVLSLIKDNISGQLNGGTALTAGQWLNLTDIPLVANAVYNLAFSVAGAKIQATWIDGV